VARTILLFLMLLVGCNNPPNRSDPVTVRTTRDSSDRTFALVRTRGHAAMGVDQYTSFHRFEPLPDGGRIALQRDPTDSAGVAQIRSHMQVIAQAFRRGDFSIPGFVHDRQVPGTAVMAARRSRITYHADTLSGGGQVRLQSPDSTAVAAIHEFLAFQRHDHRSQ
jgi:hypothetical protein